MAREYYRGMPYGEFVAMMAERQRKGKSKEPVGTYPGEDELQVVTLDEYIETVKPCEHPFELVTKKIRGHRRPADAGHPTGGIRITVEYHCTGCDADLPEDSHSFKLGAGS